jgi:hypothetical protein
MSDRAIPITTASTPTVRINGEDKPGLIRHHTETHSDPLESWKMAADQPSVRDQLFELIDINEKLAADIIEYEQYVYADDSQGSIIYAAEHLARQIAKVRFSVTHFEKHTDDAGVLSRFYDAMRDSLELAGDLEIVTVKRNELAIIRGDEKSYNGNGSNVQLQRDVVRQVRGSMRNNPDLGKNEAIRQVMAGFDVSRSQVNRFLKKF